MRGRPVYFGIGDKRENDRHIRIDTLDKHSKHTMSGVGRNNMFIQIKSLYK